MSLFDFFKKKAPAATAPAHPIRQAYDDLTTNQKLSVLNLLFLVGVSNKKDDSGDAEVGYLNTYVSLLGVRQDNATAYLKQGGADQVVADLTPLTLEQKELLALGAWGMLTCNGRPNETGLQFAIMILTKIGIDQDSFLRIVRESKALMQRLGL